MMRYADETGFAVALVFAIGATSFFSVQQPVQTARPDRPELTLISAEQALETEGYRITVKAKRMPAECKGEAVSVDAAMRCAQWRAEAEAAATETLVPADLTDSPLTTAKLAK
jgi:uncharacterized membrane protein YqiK